MKLFVFAALLAIASASEPSLSSDASAVATAAVPMGGSDDTSLLFKGVEDALALAYGEEQKNQNDLVYTQEDEDSETKNPQYDEEEPHAEEDGEENDLAVGKIVAHHTAVARSHQPQISPLRCEGTLSKLKKRDSEEEARSNAELAMIKLVRVELKKLEAINRVSGKDLEIPEGSEADILLLSLGVTRKHSEVTSVFGLLDTLEKKLLDGIRRNKDETENTRLHCVQACRASLQSKNARVEAARRAHAKTQETVARHAAIVSKEEGSLKEVEKELRAAQAAYDKEEANRAKELAILQVLENKLTAVDNVKALQIDLDETEPRVGLRDWAKDAKAENLFGEITTMLLDRQHAETGQLRTLIRQLSAKIIAERVQAQAELAKKKHAAQVQHSAVQTARAESLVSERKEAAAKDLVKQLSAKVQSLTKACSAFSMH